MSKALKNFNAEQSLKNARGLVKHCGKHPMSMCFFSQSDAALHKTAVEMVAKATFHELAAAV